MRRDRRLLIPIGLFLVSLVALAVQAWTVAIYIQSSILDPNWETMVQMFGVEAPANGPDVFCFDYCAPKLPFVAGWIGIGAFLAGLLSLIFRWWKSQA